MSEAKLAPNMPKWMVDHVDKYLSSGGKEGHMYTLTPPNSAPITVPSLLLITTGRKSGQKFLFPLFYGRTGDSYIIVASKGGAPDHPGWYKNLLAHPDIEIQVWDKVIPVTAHTGSAAEKQRVWPAMVKEWPDYANYQAGTKRDIPVVFLRPR